MPWGAALKMGYWTLVAKLVEWPKKKCLGDILITSNGHHWVVRGACTFESGYVVIIHGRVCGAACGFNASPAWA